VKPKKIAQERLIHHEHARSPGILVRSSISLITHSCHANLRHHDTTQHNTTQHNKVIQLFHTAKHHSPQHTFTEQTKTKGYLQ